jgi:hypothetical protein
VREHWKHVTHPDCYFWAPQSKYVSHILHFEPNPFRVNIWLETEYALSAKCPPNIMLLEKKFILILQTNAMDET